jgi:hypothetical protein
MVMANRQAFGRRINPKGGNAPIQPAAQRAAGPATAAPVEHASPMSDAAQEASLDAELQAWKRARGSGFKMPWSQLALMASLCFSIASFVLPDSINSSVNWLLWGLSGMSAFVWFSNRRKKKLRERGAP